MASSWHDCWMAANVVAQHSTWPPHPAVETTAAARAASARARTGAASARASTGAASACAGARQKAQHQHVQGQGSACQG
eukprot:358383-Chlamydomonas_euryale.AAC.1